MKKCRLVFDVQYNNRADDDPIPVWYYKTLVDEEDVEKTSALIDKLIEECDPKVILHKFDTTMNLFGSIKYLSYHFEDVDVEAPWETASDLLKEIETSNKGCKEHKLIGTKVNFVIKNLSDGDSVLVALNSFETVVADGNNPIDNIPIRSDDELVLVVSQILGTRITGLGDYIDNIRFSVIFAPEYVDFVHVRKVMINEAHDCCGEVYKGMSSWNEPSLECVTTTKDILNAVKTIIHECQS